MNQTQEPASLKDIYNLQLRHHEEQRHTVAALAEDVRLIRADIADLKAGIVRERRASHADAGELERDAGAVMLGAQHPSPSLWVRATQSRAALTIATAIATAITTLAAQYAAHGSPTP